MNEKKTHGLTGKPSNRTGHLKPIIKDDHFSVHINKSKKAQIEKHFLISKELEPFLDSLYLRSLELDKQV